jgi:TonB family protein
MYFDFDDRYEQVEAVGSAISRREGVVLSVVVHVGIVLALLFAPKLAIFQPSPEELQAREERQRQQARNEESPRLVVVEPLRDVPAPTPPPKADLSDMDRQASAPAVVERPENALPFARGNSTERVEAAPDERARGQGPEPEPAPPAPERTAENAAPLPPSDTAQPAPRQAQAEPQPPQRAPGGQLGEALRDLQKYVQRESYNNPNGGVNEFGPAIQFDTKGVEFGPWIRRFIAQVKRNWIVPNSALAMRGRVVIQFNVHKDGSITDLTIVRPSEIDSFNRSAANALMMSNPTTPLPPEYPDDKAFFTVTFYFNESPAPQ